MVKILLTDPATIDNRSLVGQPGSFARKNTTLSGIRSRLNRSQASELAADRAGQAYLTFQKIFFAPSASGLLVANRPNDLSTPHQRTLFSREGKLVEDTMSDSI